MSTTDDLPARLRACITESGGIDLHGEAGAALLREAAERIEALQREVETERQGAESIQRMLSP